MNEDPYNGVPVDKEECLNHEGKRRGTALLKKSKESRFGGNGRGQLRGKVVEYLQARYRFAIFNNILGVDAVQKAVFPTLLHVMSTDDVPQHG